MMGTTTAASVGAKPRGRTLVLGLGSRIRRDDGVGPRVLDVLGERLGAVPGEVELVEGGLSPFEALCGRGGGKLVVVDAAHGGREPGTVYLSGREGLEPSSGVLSLHGLGLSEALAELELSGDRWDEVVVLGVEPADTSWGEELSPQVERALGRVVALVEREIPGRRCK